MSATNLAAIAAGWYHNLALTSNGTVRAWGRGTSYGSSLDYGQSIVPSALSNVAAIAAGGYHSLALRSNGTVVAWGRNTFGQTSVPQGLVNVIAIAAGGSNSLALKKDGTLVAWGANGSGQSTIPAGLSNVVAIACGAAHSLALKHDGTLVAWGSNEYNQTNIPAGLTNIIAVSAGIGHSLALAHEGPIVFLARSYEQTIWRGGDTTISIPFLGSAPLTYQWLKEGAPIAHATNASLFITNALFADTGSYQLAVSNTFGVVTGVVVSLRVHDTAPTFRLQPPSIAVRPNDSTSLSASVEGLPPLTYQWLFNGSPIPGATNNFLTVSNAQQAHEGMYSLLASNAIAVTVSSNAFLNVIDLTDALGLANITPVNPSQPAWFVQTTNTLDGFAAAVSPPSYSIVGLQTAVSGPGTLTFWWASSGSPPVSFSLIVNNTTRASQSISSSSGWQKQTIYLDRGIHILNWRVSNRSFDPSIAFLDQVTFTPGATPSRFTSQPASQTNAAGNNVTFSIGTLGTPPIRYQWFFNGTALPGAIGPSLALNNIQANNAGIYSVVADNGHGPSTSSNATLVVTPSAPVFTTQPSNAPQILGNPVTLSAAVVGTSPITYQWAFNGQPIPGATNLSLTLSNAQYSDAGIYTLLASNPIGSTTSFPAPLSVFSSDQLGEALSNPSLGWSTTDVPWFPQTNITHDGVSAAQSGLLSDAKQSTLQCLATGPATVIYWWKVNCSSFWMKLAFAVDDTMLHSISGNVDWQQATNFIGEGTHALQWKLYPYRNAVAGGTAWLDQVQIIPGGTAVAITSQPVGSTNSAGTSVTLSVSAIGTPPFRYQWQLNGSDLPGATNGSLVMTNIQVDQAGVYSVVVANDYGSAISSNATLAVIPSAPVITSHPKNQTQLVNSSVTLSVAAQGSSPLLYQWYFNGMPLSGANNNTLVLAGVQATHSGSYSVMVSNSLSVVTSTSAYVDVAPVMALDIWPDGGAMYFTPPRLGNLTAVAAGAKHTLALRDDGGVVAWGNNMLGQTNVPTDLSNVVAIAAGFFHSLALKTDGTVVAWGDNTLNQTNLPPGLGNVVAIAAGAYHSLALMNDGTVTGWGNNVRGQIDIPSSLTNVQAISAGYYMSYAICPDGSVVQWGSSPEWVHNGTYTQLSVAPGHVDVAAVAAGGFSGWSLNHDGTAFAWGWNEGTAPATNTFEWLTSSSGEVRGQTTFPNIAAVASGGGFSPEYEYALVLRNDGRIFQIGDYYSYIPSTGSTIPNNVVAVAASILHGVVLVNDGTPRVARTPLNRIANSGDTVVFSSGIVAPAAHYQWHYNGADIEGATNSLLALTNVPLTASGLYRCVATNSFGSVTNPAAALTVLRSKPRFNPASLVFTNGSFGWRLDKLSGEGALVIYASSNLIDWLPILTNPPQAGSFPAIDASPSNQPMRFYRAMEQ